MEIDELEKRLEKISIGCEKCKAKMCNICPNGKMKKMIKTKLKDKGIKSEKESTLIEKIKGFFIKN